MKSDTLTFQVKFWALIGPFICLLSLVVFTIKGSTTTATMPLILLFGVLFCWKWKVKGFAFSVTALALHLFYSYSQYPLEERFWQLGMGISMAMSLLITALSFEEVEALVEGLKVESRSRLENLWKVDERLQQSLEELKKKKERIRELNIKARSYQKLVDRSVEEMIEFRTKQDESEQELLQANSEKEKLKSLLEASKKSALPAEEQQQIHANMEEKQHLLQETKERLLLANKRILTLEKELEEMKMSELGTVEKALERHIQQMEKERIEQEAAHRQEIEILQNMLGQYAKQEPTAADEASG